MELVSAATRSPTDTSLDAALEFAARAVSALSAGGRTVVIALPAPQARMEALLECFPNEAAVLWMPPEGLSIAGVGQTSVLRTHGAQRMAEMQTLAAATWQRIVVVEQTQAPVPGPRFFGGFSFQPESALEPPWTQFGDGLFFLPELSYVRDTERAWLLLAVTPEVGASEASRALQIKRTELALHALHGSERNAEAEFPQVRDFEIVDEVRPDTWCQQVEHIRQLIATGSARKVVAARRTTLRFRSPLRAVRTLTNPAFADAKSTRFAVRVGESTFLGASPERLVARSGRSVRADALAGSSAPTLAAELELLSGIKERTEHEIVVAEIVRGLSSHCQRLSYPAEPLVRRLRYVQHLHTPIAGTLTTPTHVLQLLQTLHPTPAVAGTPTRAALEWINAHESAARGWYAGPVGWFDRNGNGEFVVALRSALLTPDAAHVYAGAGIVAASDPKAEYHETELKMQLMLDALTQSTAKVALQ